jgi:pilus assembly protein CpaB
VRRRARAVAFAALALVCAALAASLAGEYRGGVEAQLGQLRPVVVARSEVEGPRPLRPADTRELLEVRRVPARFAPVDALSDPVEAVGLTPRGAIPAGSYVTAALLRVPGGAKRPPSRVGSGREAVEIAIAGAGALAATGDPLGHDYDVVATSEPGPGGGAGRTRLVAEDVRLLALQEAGGVPGPEGLGAGAGVWTATLAVGRDEALGLIQAHNFAREVRLIAAAR